MSNGSVLIIDDEESVLVTMQAILEMDGYAVTTASKGNVALDLLAQTEFDVVLTDLRLDDTDGLAILADLRRRSPDTVAIMLTGYASLETAVQALREGAYDYLVKPSDVVELRATVARGMERRQLALQLKARVRELEEANRTINSLNQDLKQRVEEATAELTERMEELAQANAEIANLYRQAEDNVAKLQEMDRLKSRFLSMASHELKTPLTAIYGVTQLVQRRLQKRRERGRPAEGEWEQEQQQHAQQIQVLQAQTQKLVRLVDELLDVSRIESGRVELRVQQVDVRQLVNDVVERIRLTSENHQLKVELPSEALFTTGDADHLEQVLNNLIGNAIKYSPEGGPIRVGVRCVGNAVRISVRDNGVGIPESELDAVFGLFYRAPESGERASGMGLGLYISKEIVVRHGGKIWAESTPGKGSTFHVELPRAEVPAETVAPA